MTSPFGSLEEPVNPLLYVLAYGAGFVAQGRPPTWPGMTAVIEEAIRYPGFSFVNVQSPCVTFGEEDQQVKAHRAKMKTLASLGHDPSGSHARDGPRLSTTARSCTPACSTGTPAPPPTYGALVRERQAELQGGLPRERILDSFIQRT